jgi:hypothetical protein
LELTVAGVGASAASLQFVFSALPVRYGRGLGGPADSDGRAIWRMLTGAPPGLFGLGLLMQRTEGRR